MSTHRITITKLPDPFAPTMERNRAAYARRHGVPMPAAAEPEESAPRPAVAAGAPSATQRIAANLRKIADRMEGNVQ